VSVWLARQAFDYPLLGSMLATFILLAFEIYIVLKK